MSNPPRDATHGPAPDARLVALSYRVFRLLLVCYPRSFRGAFGHDMAVVFRDASRAAYRRGRSGAVLGLWRVALPDLLVAAAQERLKEGIQMNRQGLLRFSALALLVAGAAQLLLAIVQVVLSADLWVALFGPTGGWDVQSPWIGRGEVALSLGPIALLFLLIGMVGLHRLAHRRLGAVGWIAITLVVLGLAVEIGAGAVMSAETWPSLSQCINLGCSIVDPTSLLGLAQAVNLTGVIVTGIGFALYGLAMVRSRLLPHGNGLPVLLGVASTLPLVIFFAVFIILDRTDAITALGRTLMIRVDPVLALGSVLETILIIRFGRTLLQASPEVALA